MDELRPMGSAEREREFITYGEAGGTLGCGVSNMPKMLRRGALKSRGRGHGPSLRRSKVEKLAIERSRGSAALALSAAETLQLAEARPPVDLPYGSQWLSVTHTSSHVGVSPQAVRKRCRRGTIPHVVVGAGSRRAYWMRSDHMHLVRNVRLTDRPEAIATVLVDPS